MIKVLIVDDHKIVRDGISALLKQSKDINFTGECTDGSEVMGFLTNNKVDVILMDIAMHNTNGVEASKMVKEKYPDIRILALSMNDDFEYINEMMKVGVEGYCLKNTSGEELEKAIRVINDGNHYYSQEVTNIVMTSHMQTGKKTKKTPDKHLVEQLTKREIEILQLIAQEYTNVEIAEKLFISRRTVDTHRRNLLQKIGVKNSIGLIRFAYTNGLLE